jgi:hypothetical protein
MRISGRFLLAIPAMIAMLLLISACSVGGTGSGSNLTVLQVVQKSTDAMKNLKSSHVELQSTSMGQTDTTGTPTANATPTAGASTVTIKGSGDQALPNQMQLNLTINQGTQVTEILDGENVYIKNTDGKWYVIDKQNIQGALANTLSNFSFSQNDLLGVLAHTQINDHGDEMLNGQSLRHISASLDRDALKQLLQSNPQLIKQFGQQDVDTLVNNLKSFTATVDTWIDETNFYVHRTELKVNLAADTSQVGNGAPNNIVTNTDTIVDLSNFNETVSITPPTDATPITDPAGLAALQ